jgi:aspartate oxidase
MGNAIQPPYDQVVTPQNTDQFDIWGHPGKFYKSILASGTQWFTGSDFGAGAVIVASGGTGSIYLSNGGSIDAADLAVGYIHELSIEHVENASNIYVLIRNQAIR